MRGRWRASHVDLCTASLQFTQPRLSAMNHHTDAMSPYRWNVHSAVISVHGCDLGHLHECVRKRRTMHVKQKTVRIKQEVQTLKARLRHMGWSGTDEKTDRRVHDCEGWKTPSWNDWAQETRTSNMNRNKHKNGSDTQDCDFLHTGRTCLPQFTQVVFILLHSCVRISLRHRSTVCRSNLNRCTC